LKVCDENNRIRIEDPDPHQNVMAPEHCSKVLVPQLATASGYQKLAIAILIIQWLELPGGAPDCLDRTTLPAALLHCLNTTWNFSEVASLRARLLGAGKDYLASLKHSHPSGAVDRLFKRELCSPEDVEELVGPVTEHLLAEAKGLKARTVETLMERRAGLAILLQSYRAEQAGLERITMASLAGALVHIGPGVLPEKLNPVIRPLMEAVKSETNEEFQRMAARGVVLVIQSCLGRTLSPADKLVKNVCSLACSLPLETPPVDLAFLAAEVKSSLNTHEGILSLVLNEKKAEKAVQRVRNKTKKAVKKKEGSCSNGGADAAADASEAQALEEENTLRLETQCRGARHVLKELVTHFQQDVFLHVPKLHELAILPLLSSQNVDAPPPEPHVLVTALRVLAIIIPVMPVGLHGQLQQLIPSLLSLSVHYATAVRYMAAQAVAVLARLLTDEVMTAVVETLLPQLDDALNITGRQAVFRISIRIHRIHMFLGLPDPEPLVRGMDPDLDPSIIMQK
jgi:hypothetical protein